MSQLDSELAKDCARFYDDPVGWAYWAFDWGQGSLYNFDGLDTWQENFLRDLGNHISERGFDGSTPVLPVQMAVASGHGIGKAGRVNGSALTPQGACRWGDLQPGDLLFGPDGSALPIVETRKFDRIPFYRVTFDDGSSTEVSSGHEWAVRGRKHRRNGLQGWDTMDTIDILEQGVKRLNGKVMARQWEIPQQGPAQFNHRETPLPAYFMGLWLGDGSKGQPEYAKPYREPRDNLRPMGMDVREYPDGVKNRVRDISHLFTDPVFQCGSHERYIPDDYKYNSVEFRRMLLMGLCDSDGEAHASGSIGYSTASKQLAEDVVWLARSLGCKAMHQPTTKLPSYTADDGSRVPGRPAYRVTINAPFNPFSIEHKRRAYKPSEERYLKRWIDSIEFMGYEDGMCVEVPGGLYLCNDFIVTHNSALTAITILWLMSTRPYCRGTVTANTGDQLRTKTWGELAKWKELCITGHWFDYSNSKGNMNLYHKSFPQNWRVDAVTCREEQSEAFAGQHNANSTSFYLFDEASNVPDSLWEVAMGGLTDGEPIFLAFGNPTRNTGFFRNTFKDPSWDTRQIDSRYVKRTNKELLQSWVDKYGDDDDFVRVRVKGVFPRASDMQFFPADKVENAMKRPLSRNIGDEPLICGIDLSRGGGDKTLIQFRRGKDARSEKRYQISGEKTRNSMKVVSLIAMVLDDHQPDVIMCDVGNMGGPIGDRLRQLGYNVIDVGFGWNAQSEKKYSNRTAEMCDRLKEWIVSGGCLPNVPELEQDLVSREIKEHDNRDRLVIEKKTEMKRRLGRSPDDMDALLLTFAVKTASRLDHKRDDRPVGVRGSAESDTYNPLDRFDDVFG